MQVLQQPHLGAQTPKQVGKEHLLQPPPRVTDKEKVGAAAGTPRPSRKSSGLGPDSPEPCVPQGDA